MFSFAIIVKNTIVAACMRGDGGLVKAVLFKDQQQKSTKCGMPEHMLQHPAYF
jgi:hypothetical protein